MTHEDIEAMSIPDAIKYLETLGLSELYDQEVGIKTILKALTTYRTQVLEKVEKPFLNIASEYSKPWSKEDEVAVKCTQVFLKHVESLKHPIN